MAAPAAAATRTLAEDIDRATAHLTADQRRLVADILIAAAATHRRHAG